MNQFLSRLDKQQRRWYAALGAKKLSHGGTKQISQITGMHVNTIRRGRHELEEQLKSCPSGRIRQQGGGRKLLKKITPVAFQSLQRLVEEDTAGSPMGGCRWVRHSLRQMSRTLQRQCMELSHETIRQWLKQQGYSLKSNRKSLDASVPHRDNQFRYIRRFIRAGYPVISVDAKKKELIGNFKNPGQRWQRQATLVNAHDFPKDAVAKPMPYGIYDVVHNLGYVYVGIAAATPEFAVDAIAR